MAPSLNRTARSIGTSPTMGASADTGGHPDPIDLAKGEPAVPPPAEVVAAGTRALREGRTRYGPAAGLLELRERLARDHLRRTEPTADWAGTTDSALVTVGGKQALMLALSCMLEPGDEAIVLAPYWPSFLQQVQWCGATPVIVEPDDDLCPDPDRVRAACTERTRVLVVNSPNNPSGLVYGLERMRALVDVARDHDLWIVSDEVYRTLAYAPDPPSPLTAAPEEADRILCVESFSKRFALTGMRIGAALGPPTLIEAMTRLVTASTTHPDVVAQHAALAALDLDGSWEREQLAGYRRRRDRVLAWVERQDGLTCIPPQAALYALPDVRAWIERAGLADDAALAERIRREAGVSLLPGSAFGAPGRLRISLGAADDTFDEALARLARMIQPS